MKSVMISRIFFFGMESVLEYFPNFLYNKHSKGHESPAGKAHPVLCTHLTLPIHNKMFRTGGFNRETFKNCLL